MFHTLRTTLLTRRLKALQTDIVTLHDDTDRAEEATRTALVALGAELSAQQRIKATADKLRALIPTE